MPKRTLKRIVKRKTRKRRIDMKIKSEEKTPVLKSTVEYKVPEEYKLPKKTIVALVAIIFITFCLFLYGVINNYILNEHERTIADYTKALKIKPDDYEILKLRGNTYYDKGDFDRAIADYSEAIKITQNRMRIRMRSGMKCPECYEVLNSRGFMYFEKGNYDRELGERLSSMFGENSFNWEFGRRILRIYYKDKSDRNYDLAIKDFTDALKIKPDYDNALMTRGVAYYYKGNYDKAIADWENVLKIDSNNVDAKENLKIIRQKMSKSSN